MTAPTAPELILHNARITTMQSRGHEAQALAAAAGKFTAVGSDPQILALKGERTRVIDAGGRRVIPGLNDSHLHIIRGGLNYNLELRWDGVPSLADAMRLLREQVARTPQGQWVRVVGGFVELQFAERRLPPSPSSTTPHPTHPCSSCTSTTAPSSTAR